MFTHTFMQYALITGTAVAVLCGFIGYFVLARGQIFTGDALSHVAFTGSVGALAFGFSARLGVFVATIAVALLLATLGPRGRADDVVIGSVFAWLLGVGVLFLSIFVAKRATGNSTGGVSALFGSIFGLSARDVTIAVAIAIVGCAILAVIARPLLLASVDEAVARSRGVPVRALGYVFMLLVAVTAAEAVQVVGALLLLGLLAAPAATAAHLSARPFRAMWLSALAAVAAVWIGLAGSYVVPSVPPSSAILFAAGAMYAVTVAVAR